MLFVFWDLWLLIRSCKSKERGQLQEVWLCCALGLSLCSWAAAPDLAAHAAGKGWCFCFALSSVCISSLSVYLFALVVDMVIPCLTHTTSSCFCLSLTPQNPAWAVPRLLAWTFVPACHQPYTALVPLCWTCNTFHHNPALKKKTFPVSLKDCSCL